MKRALLIFCCVTVSGCFPFDETLANRCDGGGLTDCPVPDSGEPAGPDGGPDDDGGFNGDAGTPDGGSFDGGTLAGLSGACKQRWCWENPGIIGAASFWSVWGRADDDLWVGGVGGLVLHFDGSAWKTEPISEELLPNAVVHAGFAIPGGETWLCPSLQPPMQLTGAQPASWSSTNACGGADWWNGQSYFISTTNGPVIRSPGAALPAITNGPSVYSRKLVAAGSNGVMLAESSSDPIGLFIDWYVPGETTGHRGQIFSPDGGSLSFITAIRRGPDDELWMLGTIGASSVFGKLTDAGVTVQALPEPHLVLMDFGYEADAGWWFIGDNMYFQRGVADPLAMPEDQSDHYQTLNSSWLSPQGTLWAVGEAGIITRNGNPITPYIQDPIFDIVTTEPVIAVGGAFTSSGNVLTRDDAGTWTLTHVANEAMIAVSRLRDGGLVTFSINGTVKEGSVDLHGDPTADTNRGTLAVDPTDTIWLATANMVQFWGPDRQGHLIPPATGLAFSDLAIASDGGVLLTLRDPGGNEAGGLATLQEDAGIQWIVANKRFDAVTVYGDNFAAVSANQMQICRPGCISAATPGGSPLSLVGLSDGDMYVLHSGGAVSHFTGTNWVNASPPFGSEGDTFLVGRMRASPDGRYLYVVGDDGAILRRSLP